LHVAVICKSKDKSLPLQVRTGPEGSGKLRLEDIRKIGTWMW